MPASTDEERLIVFLKAPRPGTVKTRLARALGPEVACDAYRRLVATLLNQLAELPGVELCYSPDDALEEVRPWLREGWRSAPQRDGDLGERLRRAFDRTFAEGAERIVVVGSDCPTVIPSDIHAAWNGLHTHDVVLGPAIDGGYWLIGLRRPQPELFRDIPWGESTVLRRTVERARRSGLSLELLREQRDIDTVDDWRHFLDGP